MDTKALATAGRLWLSGWVNWESAVWNCVPTPAVVLISILVASFKEGDNLPKMGWIPDGVAELPEPVAPSTSPKFRIKSAAAMVCRNSFLTEVDAAMEETEYSKGGDSERGQGRLQLHEL